MRIRLLVLVTGGVLGLASAGPTLGSGLASTVSVAETEGGLTEDFNGDGYADLAIGVPDEDVGSVVDAGGVNVIYGSSSGLSATATPDQFWSQDSPDVEDVAQERDHFGGSLAGADFNGDGYADLAIGVPFEDVGAAEDDAGGVNVLYGSSSGLSATANRFWNQNRPNVEGVAELEDYFGYALAGADFNGDGYADLAIGVPREDIGAFTTAGGVNVIYGSATGLSATGIPDQLWSQGSLNVEGVPGSGDEFGHALAAANFGGTSEADLAIGVRYEDSGGISGAGGVNAIYGSSAGLSATGTPNQFWSQDSPDVEDVPEPADQFGYALAAANFGGTSDADLAVGVPYENVGSVVDPGGVNVIYGSPSGLSATATPDQFWSQDTLNVEGMSDPSDELGYALAAANFGGSSDADLAIGVRLEDVAGVTNVGGVNVIYGSSAGLSATAIPDQFWYQGSLNVEGTPDLGDHFGRALAAANFGGSSHADLAIGVPFEHVGTFNKAGGVNVIYGSFAGLSATGTPDQFWSQYSPNVAGGPETGDSMGEAVAAMN